MPNDMANALNRAISSRGAVQAWYQHLPEGDPRRIKDKGHRNIIKILKDGKALLEHKGVLSR